MRRNNFGGDFNLVLDVQKDKKGGNPVKKSLQKVKYIVDSLDLTNIWRFLNADTKRFTWRRRNAEIQCRLDFFLISASLISTTSRADILPGFTTDHSLLTLHLTDNTNPKGPGFWKLNTCFLSDEEYIGLIKKTIKEVANEYKNNNEVHATLLWDTMKMKIRSSSVYYAKKER